MIAGMRLSKINLSAAIVIATSMLVGARCLKIFLVTPLASAASISSSTSPSTEVAIPTATDYVSPLISTVAVSIPTELVPSPTATQELPTPTPLPYTYGPEEFPENINPLTGLPAADPALLERRPMVIKISNFPRRVRPQWGLNFADNVYEYYIGDNLTRFIGIFYGQNAERVGPVRSARLFDEHLMRMYHGIFVFGYADDRILEQLMVPDLIPYLVFETHTNCPPICRLEHYGLAYNNLFADTRTLGEYVSKRGVENNRQNLNGLFFGSQIPLSGQGGEKIQMFFTYASHSQWQYDYSVGRYLRYQDVENNNGQPDLEYLPLIDSMNSQQVAADNIVVLRVEHQIVYKSSSTQIDDMPIVGKGSGYAFRDAQIYPIKWVSRGGDGLISLYLPDGSNYPLKPGNVWFEIIGKTSLFEAGEDGWWIFKFHMP